LRVEEVVAKATVGAAILVIGRCWFAGDEAIETATFEGAMDGEDLAVAL
jgi:hypothetical protein